MNYCFFFLLLVIVSCTSQVKKSSGENRSGLPEARNKSESAKETATNPKQKVEDPHLVAERFKPENATIVHSLIQTSLWGKENCIIVFYEGRFTEDTQYQYEHQCVDAYLLVPNEQNAYEKVLIYHFEDDNVDTEIQSVFFANADSDPQKELIILSTCYHRLQYLYEGTEYNTSVFDNFDTAKPPKKMTYLSKISAQLDGGFEGFLESNPNSEALFKTASDIKKELKRLGYN